jgi:hypothetical protein
MNRHTRLFSLALAFALTASMLAGIDRLAKFEASQAQAPQMAQAAAPRG